MKLTEYLELHKLSVQKFAEMIFTSRATVYHWRNGTYKPSKHFAMLIEHVTHGQIKPKDWK